MLQIKNLEYFTEFSDQESQQIVGGRGVYIVTPNQGRGTPPAELPVNSGTIRAYRRHRENMPDQDVSFVGR